MVTYKYMQIYFWNLLQPVVTYNFIVNDPVTSVTYKFHIIIILHICNLASYIFYMHTLKKDL